MKSLQLGILVCCAAVLAATTVVTAQPSVTGASGTFSHGQTVTITGSSFGTKTTAAPVMWDNCSTGTYPSDKGWNGSWPNAGNSAYWTKYTTPIRGVGLPHSNITRYIAGCHGDGHDGTGPVGTSVMVYKSRSITSFPAYTYFSWYYRADDNWVFNITNPGNTTDNNFKSYDYSNGGQPYAALQWYLADGLNHPVTPTEHGQWITDGSLPPDQNGHNSFWGAASSRFGGAWAKVQLEIKITDQIDGYIKLWDNGVQTINYVGQTDFMGGTSPYSRSDSMGGYARDYGSQCNGNNWRYFADAYLDYTPSRVVLANNSNIDNATIIENQIPSAWSATSITATVNMGQFTSGTAYLFVYDSTGAHNATGWPVTLGGTSVPSVSIAATTPNASESGPTAGVFTVTRTGSTGSSLTVYYGMSGSATDGTDYTPTLANGVYSPTLSGSVTIPAGSSTANITITPVDDALVEGPETLTLNLITTANYTVDTVNHRATVTIADNDGPSGSGVLVDFGSVSDGSGNTYGLSGFNTGFLAVSGEGSPGVWTYSNWYAASGSVYGVKGPSDGTLDYMGVRGSGRMFNSGDQIVVTWYNSYSSAVTIHPKVCLDKFNLSSNYNINDPASTWYDMNQVTIQPNQSMQTTYTITPASAGTRTCVAVCRVTQWNNTDYVICDKIEVQSTALPTVTVAATTPNASEYGPTNGVFTVTRTGSTSGSLVVNYAMSGTATNGTDYSTLSGSVTIASGSATALVTVTPLNDSLVEGNETAILTISANANYTVGSPSAATVTIADNDYVLVNFGSLSDGSDTVYGTSWNSLLKGRYSTWSAAGPYGFKGSYTGNGHNGGVSKGTGTAYTFTQGQVIKVTWYNAYTSSVIAFNPKISFDNTSDPPTGTWYSMTTVPSMAAGATQTCTYTIDATTAGSHTAVYVSRMTDDNYLGSVVLDKIELLSPDGTGHSPMLPTGGAEAMTAQQPAQSTDTSLPARRTVGWQPATPAAQPATKK